MITFFVMIILLIEVLLLGGLIFLLWFKNKEEEEKNEEPCRCICRLCKENDHDYCIYQCEEHAWTGFD